MSVTWRHAVLAYIVGFILSWPLATGIFFGSSANNFESCARCSKGFADLQQRKVLGSSVAMGFLYATIWPIGIPAALCLTGFAEHGIRFHILPSGERENP